MNLIFFGTGLVVGFLIQIYDTSPGVLHADIKYALLNFVNLPVCREPVAFPGGDRCKRGLL